MSEGADKDPFKNPEKAQAIYTRAGNEATDDNTEAIAADMATGTDAAGSDSKATITVEDVDKFNYDKAYDWLDVNDVDPGNLQSLPELIKLIKSHITKAKSQEDLRQIGKDVTVASANVTGGVSFVRNCSVSFTYRNFGLRELSMFEGRISFWNTNWWNKTAFCSKKKSVHCRHELHLRPNKNIYTDQYKECTTIICGCRTILCTANQISGHHWQMSHLLTKPTKWHVRPAKTQISLGIRLVWSDIKKSLGP